MRSPGFRPTSGCCLVLGLLFSACSDESAPPDGAVLAYGVQDSFVVTVDDPVLTRVLVYNTTRVPITIPRCQAERGYPDSAGMTVAMGFQIYRLHDNGDWSVYGNAQVPRCSSDAIPELATVVQPGDGVEAQTLYVPREPGRYSWIVGYTTEAEPGCCHSAATPVVTVVVQ